MTETVTVRRLRVAAALVALSAAPLLAQNPPSFADSQKANAAMLHQSTWKSRTELKLKGESKNVKLEQVRYDLNGTLQKTALTQPPPAAPPPSGRGGRLKKKMIQTKKEEFAEMMQGLGQLAGSYGHLPPDKLQAFKASATTARGTGAMQGTAQVVGLNVLLPGDSVTIWLDPAVADDAARRNQNLVREQTRDRGHRLPDHREWADLPGADGARVSGEAGRADRRQLRIRAEPAVSVCRMSRAAAWRLSRLLREGGIVAHAETA